MIVMVKSMYKEQAQLDMIKCISRIFKERVPQKRAMPFMQCCWNVNSCKVKLIHFGRNLREKLWHLGIPKNVADQFVRDVMRSHHGGTYEGWLVA